MGDRHPLARGRHRAGGRKRGGDSWFFITDDYAFGHALERDASTVITANGGKVLGSVRPPLATPDLSSFVLQAQASKAKIIGIAAGPPNNMNEIKTAAEFGVFKGGQQMAALLALITDIHSLGLPAAQGLLLTTSFYWDMDDKTREWSKRYFAKMNRMPTMWQAGVYSSVMSYLKAIKDTGTDEPLKVAAKMREKPIEDFFSRNGKLREDNLMVHDLCWCRSRRPRSRNIRGTITVLPRSRRGSVRPAGSGMCDGEEVTSSDGAVSEPRVLWLPAHRALGDVTSPLRSPANISSRRDGSIRLWRGSDRVCRRGLAGLRQLLAEIALDACSVAPADRQRRPAGFRAPGQTPGAHGSIAAVWFG